MAESSSGPIRVFSVQVLHPGLAPRASIVSSAGEIDVWGTVPNTFRVVRARVYRAADLQAGIPDRPPEGDTLVISVDLPQGGFYRLDRVPNVQANDEGTACDNTLVVWGTMDPQPTQSSFWEPTDLPFCGQYQVITRMVSAKCCLWFAWAPRDVPLVGPQGEEGDDYRPAAVSVPDDAKTASVTASGQWRHHPIESTNDRTSGPDGLDPAMHAGALRGLEDGRYQSDTYRSGGITAIPTNLNRLVGLWQETSAEPGGGDPLLLGTAPEPIEALGKFKLFLGFHDGRHWTNNSGEATVTIEWTPIDPADQLAAG